MPDFSSYISLNIPFIFVLLILFISLAIAYAQYYKTIPIIGEVPRYVLIVLRAITLFSVILLFLKPILDVQYKKAKVLRTDVYFDNSLSMTQSDGNKNRWETVDFVAEELKSNNRLFWNVFNATTHRIHPDSLASTNNATNFQNLLSHINRSEADNIIIVSDGNPTEGDFIDTQPGFSEKNIFTVGIGPTANSADVFIEKVSLQPIGYNDIEQEIRVSIGNISFKNNIQSTINLFINNSLIKSEPVYLSKEDASQDILFKYLPKKEGLNKIKIAIPEVEFENYKKNNQKIVTQQILSRKVNILLISGTPGYDSKFLHRVLQDNKDFDISYLTEHKAGLLKKSKVMDLSGESDVIILHNFPGPHSTNAGVLEVLLSRIKKKRIPVIFFLSNATDLTRLKLFQEYLPFQSNPLKTSKNTYRKIMIKNNSNLLDLFADSHLNTLFWKSIYPLEDLLQTKSKNNNDVILQADQIPVLVKYEHDGFRNIFFNGAGFWQWKFFLQDRPEILPGYQNLIEHAVRWVFNPQRQKSVVLKPQSESLVPGEPLLLQGFLYDASFNPVIDGYLNVTAEWSNGKTQFDIIPDSSGKYEAVFIPQKTGRIKFNATGKRDEQILGIDAIELIALPVEKEFLKSTQNQSYLQSIARNNNGQYFSPDGVDSLLRIVKEDIKQIEISNTYALWYHPFLLTVILISIISEWIIRKKFGLV